MVAPILRRGCDVNKRYFGLALSHLKSQKDREITTFRVSLRLAVSGAIASKAMQQCKGGT